jgi:hypothetical protein
VLHGEAAYTNCIVLVLTRPGLELTINHTQHEHATHYTTELPQLIRYVDLIYSQYTYIVGKNKRIFEKKTRWPKEKKYKRTNNVPQNIHTKLKIE